MRALIHPPSPFSRLKTQNLIKWERACEIARCLRRGEKVLPKILSPLQLEIHLGYTCLCRCDHCLGKYIRQRLPILPIEKIIPIILKLQRNGVSRLELSGVFTDPLSYPYISVIIQLIQEIGIPFGLHTKMLSTPPKFIELLARTQLPESYIAVNIDYYNNGLYDKLLHPREKNGLERVKVSLEKLCAEIHQNHTPFELNLRTLVMQHTSLKDLLAFGRWYYYLRATYKECTINWRFSSPWLPTGASKEQLQSNEQIFITDEKNSVMRLIDKLIVMSKNFPGKGTVSFRDEKLSVSCRICLNQLLYGAIGSDGNFYPCQGIAAPLYNRLVYGNLYTDDFFARWYQRSPYQLLLSGKDCPRCAAPTEAQINRAEY